MNNDESTIFQANVLQEMPDDLKALSQAFSLPKLSYIDISRQERLTKMMIRWPLLSELSELTKLAELANKTGSA
ncbi:cellulose biosynthesis protein BcsR [Serratia sp. DD3]|uniref:cellulose biosynthesis protein BcsR n=1 Tax=Serratia sp. DD3 TaxID=1410619 RepID=UPI0004D47CE9|nr:cellulose biosynthesis protein BcsR [Serratia sp. DD3]KEY60464.1 hypothetical protein SRDD_06260 [Serratia sp. DD3]